MTTIFFYVLLFQIKDWDKICEEEGKYLFSPFNEKNDGKGRLGSKGV